MADDAPELPFQPIAYPAVWDRSCELHPRGPGYCWREHLRTLCRLCKAYLASDPRSRTPWSLVPELERAYVARRCVRPAGCRQTTRNVLVSTHDRS
jgi:hypothetical protein